ncbi:MAG: hypothetical protein KatS3mg019_1217 [Fimbriimonadales bacterium]|nr:MAG: hypothetical protein KatS3mg019_1217 [Fimbriimonadales bacterium]
MPYRKVFWWWTLVVWAVGIGTPNWAQLVEERLLTRGEVRSYSTSYAHNNRVYVTTSSEVMLAIYDFGGASPTLRGRLNYPGNIPRLGISVLVDGNYAYVLYAVTSGSSDNVRLAVINVSNSDTPQLAGELALPSTDPFYLNFAKSGNYLYLFPYEGNFAVVDVSNPANPTRVRLVNATAAWGVVVGNRLYTAEAANGIGVWDISQPDNPSRIGSVGAGTNVRRITASGGKLYALKTSNPPLRLYIFDLSNPDSPTQVGNYDTERVAGLAAVGNFVFLSGYERGTDVVDVSTPSAPASVRVLTYSDVQNADPVSGKVLIQGQSILALYDPATQGTTTLMYPYPLAVVQQGTTVFYAEEQQLTALDITNPAAPSVRGTAFLPLQRTSGTDLALIGSGRVAVAINGVLHLYEQVGNSLNLLFQDDPGGFSLSRFNDRVRLGSAALAMATRQNQIQIYDISNPAAPQRAGSIFPASNDFDIDGNTLYLAENTTSRSLRVYDLTDPNNPVQLASVNLPQTQFISDVAVGGGYVLTTDWHGNLALVDVRVRTNPQVVATYALSGVSMVQLGYDPAVNVFYAYDGDNRRVFLFRVSDFPTLNPVAMTLSRRMYRFSFNGEQVLGAGREEGLVLYRNTLFGGPTLSVSGITPAQGANQGSLRVAIIGAGFEPGATVRLERGSMRIQATEVEFVSATRLNATFQFNGEPVGTQWDVVVRLPNNLEARLANGFSIVEAVPNIATVSPGGARPLSTFTVTITGSLFLPGAQVTLLPPTGISVDPLNATTVEYLSQTQIRATFNLTPYQQIESGSDTLTARLQVRNPNQQVSNLVNWVLQFPTIDVSANVRSLELTQETTSFAIEVEVRNALDTEPLRAEYRITLSGGQERRISPSQVQSLGNRRWRLTFPAEGALPSNFADTGRLYIYHMGRRDDTLLTLYRPYAARISYPVQQNNLTSPVRLYLQITNDSPAVTVVLRQGDRVIEPSQLSRTPDGWLMGVTQVEAQFPIRLEDLGNWTAEVRYSETQVARVENAVQVSKGQVILRSAQVSQPCTVFGTLVLNATVEPPLQDVQFVLRIPQQNSVTAAELRPTRVQYSTADNTFRLEFDNVETAVSGAAYCTLETRHPFLERSSIPLYTPIRGGTLDATIYMWVPSGYRAGRWNRILTMYLSAQATYPETPYYEIPIPVQESVLQAGQFQAEYEFRDGSGRVVARGVLPLTPDDYVLRGVLPPVMPNQYAYYELWVRFVPASRSAPPQLRSRVAPVVVVAVVGATVLLSYLGYELLSSTCNSEILVRAVQRKIAEDLAGQDFPPDESEVRRLIRILYDSNSKKGFVQQVLAGVTTDYLTSLGEDAAKAFLKDRIEAHLRSALPDERAEWWADTASELAPQVYNLAMGNLSFEGFLTSLTSSVVGNIPISVAQNAVKVMLEKGKECLDKVDTLSRIYTNRQTSDQRADVGYSYDPNEKNGSGGIGGFLRPDQSILYEIKFENLPTATAGAEEVLIEDILPYGLDLNTLEFVAVSVGTKQQLLPTNTTALNLNIDLRPDRPVIVQVRSELDMDTRTLRVRYRGIDPNTGDYYEQGFLPPNQNPPQGEGSVIFRIRPSSAVASGTQFANRAVITFDPHLGVNPPIVTNTHTITLDGQPPQVVVVEVPASVVPETKARLRWSVTDDVSGVEEVEIWAQEGENARRVGFTRASGERAESGEVLIRARRFGDETRILARARDRVGNANSLQDEPIATIRMGQPPQFNAGLHLIGIPLQPDANDPQPLFGFQNNQWATYNPVTGQYVQYPDAGAAPVPGRGIWVVLPNAVQPNLVGNLPDPASHYFIELQPGWNLIANPWTEPLVWHREAVQVRVQGVARPLSQAGEFVEPYLWGWEPNPSNPTQGRYVLVSDAQLLPGMQTELQPWRGYWIYAHQACTLELPTPEEAALFTGLTRSYTKGRDGGWSFRIGAHLGDQYDEVLLGVSGNERGLQVVAPPDPPTRSAYSGVRLRLTRDGVAMEADIQPRARRTSSWTLEVHVPPSSEGRTRTLLITAPDLAHLPRGVNPVLRDPQTGERRFLRNSAGWQIPVPAEGITRTYEISLTNTSRLLRIVGVQVQSSRSPHQHTVQFTLSDSARVSVTVQAGGQVVRTLEQGRSRSRGVQQVVWDGRDAQGRSLPPGNYQVVIQAETDDGQIVRAVAPITLTR